MRRSLLIICFILVLSALSGAQSLSSSNLPIVIISTDGGMPIPDNPRVLASMKIISRGEGQRNYLTDQNNPAYLNYNGRIDIEIRGSSSQYTNKKQYGFTTLKADNISDNNVSLLSMPSENDWIFNGMTYDTAMIRDYLCYNLSRQIGEYATRTAYCELIINETYKGLYLLEEKIKADDSRVDVFKIQPDDIFYPEVSGGYITKADKRTGGDIPAWTMTAWFASWALVEYFHDLPKPEDAAPQQTNYIQNQFDKLETAAKKNDASIYSGFPTIIDIPSFIDHLIISELSSNPDAYQFSTFFHKDRNGKLRAGPIWDNDLTFGNDLFFWGFDRSKTDIWQLSNGENDGSRFWYDLFNNPTFRCYLSKRWNELIQPGQPLNPASINTFIDQTVLKISEGVGREYALRGNINDHLQRIAEIKSFIQDRITWITANLGSYSLCENITAPPLVITKIMFHPASTPYFPDRSETEFIEIRNNGDQRVNLTGIYFAGTGLAFQFSPNSMIGPDSSIFLASNSSRFKLKYGFEPFGQFTRHLSDKDQNLVLADGFGNVIDNVHYYDTIPWPGADGNGSYLSLIDPDLDNNLASSWIASDELILSVSEFSDGIDMELSPNPVTDFLRIKSRYEIGTISMYDITGHLLESENICTESYEMDMTHYAKGIYIIKAVISGRIFTGKIIRE